jgi:hypothetical protein
MAWLIRMRAAQMGLGALALLSVACSGDDPEKTKPDDDGSEEEEPPPEAEEGEPDARAPMDAAKPPVKDAEPAQPDAGDGGVVAPPPLVVDAAALPKPDAAQINAALTPLPHDGDKGSICYLDMPCGNDDDLTCQMTGTSVPGICVDDCRSATDCEELDGVKGTCAGGTPFTDGQCVYGCAGPKNDGKGKCPEDMVCFNASTIPLVPDWRCRYPEWGGKKTQKAWDKCVPAHGPGDCEGLSSCVFLAGDVSSALAAHGYCSPGCTKDADCKVGEDTTGIPRCVPLAGGIGQCIITCDNPGARCPQGMNCDDIDTVASQSRFGLACVYFD